MEETASATEQSALVGLLAWSLLAWAILASPCGALPSDRSLRQYVHDTWGARDGLRRGSIDAVLQGRDGFLWLGTHQGLVRFDGFEFQAFTSADEPALRDDMILTLLEGRDGTLWIGTQAGLVRYRPPGADDSGGFSVHARIEEGLRGMVQDLYEDSKGRLWIATDNGLLRNEGDHLRVFTTEDGLPDGRVLSLDGGADGTLWVGTTGGLVRWSEDTASRIWSEKDGLPDARVRVLLVDRQEGPETLWLGTFGGLARLEDGVVTRVFSSADGLPNQVVRALHQSVDGSLWVGTNGGLARLREGSRTLEQMVPADGLSAGVVLDITEDHKGNLWIGTGGGLDRLRAGELIVYGPLEGLPVTQIWSVYEDAQERLWVGGSHGGATAFTDAGLERVDVTPGGLLSGGVYTIASSEDTLWFGGDRGLSRLRGDQWQSWTSADGLPSDVVLALLVDRDGALWVGTRKGLALLRGDTVERVYDRADGLASSIARVVLEDRRGDLWIGTNGGGVSRLRRRGGDQEILETWTQNEGLSGNFVLSLLEDDEGTIWVGTDGDGLSRWEGGHWRTFGTAQGLFDDKINQVLDDGLGHLWYSGANGIYRIAKSDFDAVAAGEHDRLTPIAFDERDGLRNPHSDGGIQSAGWRRRDGTLWWATLDGVARVDPSRVDAFPEAPETRMVAVLIDGVPTPFEPSRVLRVPPGSVQLEIRYGALELGPVSRVRFRHRLIGLDEAWSEVGERRAAFYTNLAPGDYRFEVMARHLPGDWHLRGGVLEIVVEPRFYQRRTFYILVTLVSVLGLWGLFRWRIRRHEKREAELERRVAEAMAQVKVLGGLLPICMSCKKIRDDEGYWEKLETFLSQRSEAVLSHGLCPDCFEGVTRTTKEMTDDAVGQNSDR